MLGLLVSLLAACSVGSTASAPPSVAPSVAASALGQASAGVCRATAASSDIEAARRVFTNDAHDALHALAADPRLDRASSAHLLEAMEKVESDFQTLTDPSPLGDDLTALARTTDDALRAIGEDVPSCGP